MKFLQDEKFSLTVKQRNLFQIFYKELIFFKSLFLTKKETKKRVVELIEDGIISGVLFLKKAPEGVFVDVGSGSGFPGIVLAILDFQREIILIEPSSKRAEFLKHIVTVLHFQNRVTIREEVFSRVNEKITLFKAFASLKKTLQMVRKYLPEDGISYHFKGPRYEKDWNQLSLEEKKGWKMKVFVHYKFKDQDRFILEIKRNL